MTASFRATATLALRSPLRFARRMPQALSTDHFATRVSSTLGGAVNVGLRGFFHLLRALLLVAGPWFEARTPRVRHFFIHTEAAKVSERGAMKRHVAVILALTCLMGQTAWVGRASADTSVCFTPAQNCGAICLISPSAPVVARWKVAVLCCCKTYTGGECCTEAANCGGKPPGCFCASPSAPAPNTASARITLKSATPLTAF